MVASTLQSPFGVRSALRPPPPAIFRSKLAVPPSYRNVKKIFEIFSTDNKNVPLGAAGRREPLVAMRVLLTPGGGFPPFPSGPSFPPPVFNGPPRVVSTAAAGARMIRRRLVRPWSDSGLRLGTRFQRRREDLVKGRRRSLETHPQLAAPGLLKGLPCPKDALFDALTCMSHHAARRSA